MKEKKNWLSRIIINEDSRNVVLSEITHPGGIVRPEILSISQILVVVER